MQGPQNNYENLGTLLARESYPHRFLFKFVGKNTMGFKTGTLAWASQFQALQHTSTKETTGKKHISHTYCLDAQSPQEILDVYLELEKIPDLVVVL